MHSDTYTILKAPKRQRQEGNPYYPLPPDYYELSAIGKRYARINACTVQFTPEDCVTAWDFMRSYYLQQEPARSEWYQGAEGYRKSPPAHYRLIHAACKYPRNAFAAPRAFAKSMIFRELRLLFAYTRMNFSMLLVLAREFQIAKDMDKLMRQMENNPYLLHDFGPVRPKRNDGIWNRQHIRLAHGFELVGRAVGGAMLGERPRVIHFDDAEFDPVMQQVASDLTENFERMMGAVLLPMLDKGAVLNMIGTLFSRSMFLYHVITTNDPKYSGYYREIISAVTEEGELAWEAKFDEEYLEARQQELGEDYNAQMLNRPGDDKGRILQVREFRNEWELVNPDPASVDDPLNSNATLRSWLPKIDEGTGEIVWEVIERDFGEAVRNMYILIVSDYAPTTKPTSDFSCVEVFGYESSLLYRDTFFLLDMWMGKVRDEGLIEHIWRMAQKWHPRVIGVEQDAISIFNLLNERIAAEYAELASKQGFAMRSHLMKFSTKISKAQKIASMEWRFNQGRMKYPKHLQSQWPYNQLYEQTRDFTKDLSLLRKDDAVDTMSMVQNLIKPRGMSGSRKVDEAPKTAREMLASGMLYIPGTKIPLVAAVSPSELTPEEWRTARMRRDEEREKGHRRLGRRRGRTGREAALRRRRS